MLTAAAPLAASCSADTGILIEVSSGALESQPDTLSFLVGVEVGELAMGIPGCKSGPLARCIDSTSPQERSIDVAGRDPSANPYGLLLGSEGVLADGHVKVE